MRERKGYKSFAVRFFSQKICSKKPCSIKYLSAGINNRANTYIACALRI